VKRRIKKRLLEFAIVGCMPTFAFAQSAGSFVVSVGSAWLNFGRSESQEFQSQSTFGSFASSGTRAEVHNTFTAQFLLSYFVTDNIAVEGTLGVPPELRLFAQGDAAPLGPGGPGLPLGGLHPLAKTRAWGPMLLAKYYFGSPQSKLRPYVGAGMNYTWYSSTHLNPAFSGALAQFGGSGGSVQTSLGTSWNPVFTVGASYEFARRWYLTASATYLPLRTTAHINVVSQNGNVVLSNKTRITSDPIIVFLGVGYKF
jgi:outer membrane protein